MFDHILGFLVSKLCFLSLSTQNHAESFGNYFKNSVLDPIKAKWKQKSERRAHIGPYGPGPGPSCEAGPGPGPSGEAKPCGKAYTFSFTV